MQVMKPRAANMGVRSATLSRLIINSQTLSIFAVQLTAGGQKIPTQPDIACKTYKFQGANPLPFPDWSMIMMDIS